MKNHKLKSFSVCLAAVMLFSLLNWFPAVQAKEEKTPDGMKAAEGSRVLDYVDPVSFAESRHVARIPSEELLNTYVFLNEDGTKTHYVLKENTKYRAVSGEIREKDLSLTERDGVFAVKDNEFDLSFSGQAELKWKEYSFSLTPCFSAKPEKGEKGVVLKDGAVTAAFLPDLTGFAYNVTMKEEGEIPSFVLDAKGLILEEEEGGILFKDERKTVFQLSVPVSYGANGHFAPCELRIEDLGDGRYEVRPAFSDLFEEEETEYPVLIQSVMQVTSTTLTASGTAALEDAPVYSGQINSNFGNYIYLTIGFLNNTYKIGRVFVKIPGIYNNAYFQNYTVTDMKYYLYDASGMASQPITARACTGSWTESGITWQNSSAFAMNSGIYNTKNMPSGSWTAFDLTGFISRWKNNSYFAQSGLRLNNADEATASKRKTPYSVESTTNPSYATFTVNVVAAFAPHPDGQNKSNWCWAATAKKVAFHNYADLSNSYPISTVLSDVDGIYTYTNSSNVQIPFYGMNSYGQYLADGVQRAVCMYAIGSDANLGGAYDDICHALRFLTQNDTSYSCKSVFCSEMEDITLLLSCCLSSNDSASYYIAANIHEYDIYSEEYTSIGHAITFVSISNGHYNYWDPWTEQYYYTTLDAITNNAMELPAFDPGNFVYGIEDEEYCLPLSLALSYGFY